MRVGILWVIGILLECTILIGGFIGLKTAFSLVWALLAVALLFIGLAFPFSIGMYYWLQYSWGFSSLSALTLALLAWVFMLAWTNSER